MTVSSMFPLSTAAGSSSTDGTSGGVEGDEGGDGVREFESLYVFDCLPSRRAPSVRERLAGSGDASVVERLTGRDVMAYPFTKTSGVVVL